MKVDAVIYRTHNSFEESHWVGRLRENLTSGSNGEGLETGQLVPRQSFSRQVFIQNEQHLNLEREVQVREYDGLIVPFAVLISAIC